MREVEAVHEGVGVDGNAVQQPRTLADGLGTRSEAHQQRQREAQREAAHRPRPRHWLPGLGMLRGADSDSALARDLTAQLCNHRSPQPVLGTAPVSAAVRASCETSK